MDNVSPVCVYCIVFYFTFVIQINEKSIIYSEGKYKAHLEGIYVSPFLPPQKTGKMGMWQIVSGL